MESKIIRAAISSLLAVFTAGVSTVIAAAERYPSRPIRAIVPFAPGGATDLMARTISAKLSERLGQQVVVDNRGGGGGNIAAVMAARAAPDGYTIFYATISALATNVSTFRKLPYDPQKDFARLPQQPGSHRASDLRGPSAQRRRAKHSRAARRSRRAD